MKQFAKLFEAHGRQVLILKDTDSDGDNPKLSIITRMDDGSEINLGPVFEGKNAEEELDAAFDMASQEIADAFAKQLVGCSTAFEAAKALAGK